MRIDPRTVKVTLEFNHRISRKPFRVDNLGNITTMLGNVAFGNPLDENRLQRGWSKVFSDYCHGTKKVF